jgi:beta-xylosidase
MLSTRHSYGFDNENETEHAAHLRRYAELIRQASVNHPVIIGEWSDFYHTKRADDQSYVPDPMFLQMQLDAYENAYGWYFWNFKVLAENFAGWSLERMIKMGYEMRIPLKPATPVL